MSTVNHSIWVEKYRPHRITDCILPQNIKTMFEEIVTSGTVPNMILSGKAGTGKTTAALAMCDELEIEWDLINASEKGNIDTLRTEIREFASSRSFDGSRKVVILDEADYLNASSTQPALRGFIEEFAANVSFIFTCNKPSRIIPELHSRASFIDYVIPAAEKEPMAKAFMKRLRFILDQEQVEYEPKVLAALIMKYWPDFRRTINELQTFAKLGRIDEGILTQVRDVPMSELVNAIKNSDFKTVRAWCAVHSDADSVKIMRKVYDMLYDVFDPVSIPDMVLLIGEYQYKAAFAQDQEMHLAAFLTQVMMTGEVKK